MYFWIYQIALILGLLTFNIYQRYFSHCDNANDFIFPLLVCYFGLVGLIIFLTILLSEIWLGRANV